MIVFELVQALKFKSTMPDSNLLMIINLILQVSCKFIFIIQNKLMRIKILGCGRINTIKCIDKRLPCFFFGVQSYKYGYFRMYESEFRRDFRISNRFSYDFKNEGKIIT